MHNFLLYHIFSLYSGKVTEWCYFLTEMQESKTRMPKIRRFLKFHSKKNAVQSKNNTTRALFRYLFLFWFIVM